ncbi:MAG: hypothetical protein ACOX0Z_03485 [Candidatus Nanosyncoccaceae bacterium]|jgi:hypothetical protein
MKLEFRERRVVFAIDGVLSEDLRNTLMNVLREVFAIFYTTYTDPKPTKICPHIIVLQGQNLSNIATLTAICNDVYDAFHHNQADFVITITLGWGNTSYGPVRPVIRIYQIKPSSETGRRTWASSDISNIFDDKATYDRLHKEDPWAAQCVEDKLPQRVESLRSSFHRKYRLVSDCHLEPTYGA